MKSLRVILATSFVLSLMVWLIHSMHWWVHLEGDNPLYSVMSMEVLRGKHFFVTAGQVHGGTPLVYLRAFLFSIFGISTFLGFFVSGVVIALSVVLWARFAFLVAGPVAGWVMGVLGAIGTEGFVRPALTDYYGVSLLTGGLLLNAALALAKRPSFTFRSSFLIGLLAGFAIYICRFSFLYILSAALFFFALIPASRRNELFPTGIKKSDLLGRVLFYASIAGLLLSIVAFFVSDRFLGINAEKTLKYSVVGFAVAWLSQRWKLVLKKAPMLLLAGLGFILGLLPELAYRLTHPAHADRVTGLVRWGDIASLLGQLPFRIGFNFSFYHPLTLGLFAVFCWLVVLGLGWYSKRRLLYAAAFISAILPIGAWFGIHTYMYLVVQYFFPAFFPLYLALAIAVALSKSQKLAAAFVVPVALIGLSDVILNTRQPNPFQESRILERLQEWQDKYDVKMGFGHYPSNYNLMFAAEGRWKIPFFEADERFPGFQDEVRREKRIFYIRKDGDRREPLDISRYRVLDQARLSHGFEIKVLEKTFMKDSK
ncbi:MAG: hypothetical protein AB1540_08745 [Bdellovibrionota bacterium]